MRKLLLNLHLYTALIAGALIVILGLTGSVMAFEPEIDHLRHWKLTYVTPQARALSLAEISAAISKAFPGQRIVDYGISTSAGLSYQVLLQTRKTVYVNQYTGAVLGTRMGPDFMDGLQNDIHQLHLRLLVIPKGPGADPGKTIASWAGVAMLFLLLSGLYLWWPLKRAKVQASGPPSRFWFDLHNVPRQPDGACATGDGDHDVAEEKEHAVAPCRRSSSGKRQRPHQ
jgi:uncharacterized iron-regulated membrane protein